MAQVEFAEDGSVTLTREELKAIARKNSDDQVNWLQSRGFSPELIYEAAKEWVKLHPTEIPTDGQILDVCERIARRSKPKLKVVVSN